VKSVDDAEVLERTRSRGRRKASPRTALVKETSELIMAIVERGQRELAAAAALHGLTELQIRVLRYLYRSGPTPIGVLADYLANDPSTLTTFVDRLEQREYVERRNDPDDRRIKPYKTQNTNIKRNIWLKSLRSPSSTLLNCVSSARCSRTSIRRCQGTRPRLSILPGDAPVTDHPGFPVARNCSNRITLGKVRRDPGRESRNNNQAMRAR
jgi:hypothetical protein